MRIIGLPLLMDNYAWVLASENGDRRCAVIDPSEAGPILDFLREDDLTLGWILATHHHSDHVGGVPGLLEAFPQAEVLGSVRDRQRLRGLTRTVEDGEELEVAGGRVRCLAVPGHTEGALAFHVPEEGAVFTGDTLFTGGCGRLFEGTPAQMYASLQRLAALPETTRVYCGHEYTVQNLKFAVSLTPGDVAVRDRLSREEIRRAGETPTVPAPLRLEKQTNPFLRTGEAVMRQVTGRTDPVEVFAELRRRKDAF